MVDVSIIVLSFNTKELTKECLRSIVDSIFDVSYEIIVIDNASVDGSAEEIKQLEVKTQSKNIKFKHILNSENVGYSRANNQGVKIAEGQQILFLNSDTVVYRGTVETMARFMEKHKDAGAATCLVELPDGKLDDSSHRGFPTPWRAFSHFSGLSKLFPKSKQFAGYSLGWMDLNQTHEIDSCAGAFMIVRREAGEQVGWWDEDFFWYGDDLDFCYRLKQKGWKIFFVPQVKILHYKGVSGGIKKISQHLTNATKETRAKATDARFKAMKIFYEKHYSNKYSSIVRWIIMKAINIKHHLTTRSL